MSAAVQVIREQGFSRTTTKEIARIADCSEGSLYNYFQGKDDLFDKVIQSMIPGLINALAQLLQRQGTRTVKENLADVAFEALSFFDVSTSLTAAMVAEPQVLARHREEQHHRNRGPHRANEILGNYLLAEQKLGRVRPNINPYRAADLLCGACFQHGHHRVFLDVQESPEERQQFVDGLLDALFHGLLPEEKPESG